MVEAISVRGGLLAPRSSVRLGVLGPELQLGDDDASQQLHDLALPRRVIFSKVALGDPFDLRSQGAQAGPELVTSGDRLQVVFVHRSLTGRAGLVGRISNPS